MKKMEMEINVDTLLLLTKYNRKLFEMAGKYYEVASSKPIKLNKKRLDRAFNDLTIKRSGFGLIGFTLTSMGIDVDKEFAESFVIFFNELKKRNHKIEADFRNEFITQFPEEVALGKELKTKRTVDFVTNFLLTQFQGDSNNYIYEDVERANMTKKIHNNGKICRLRQDIFKEISLGGQLDTILCNSVKVYIKRCKEAAQEFPEYKKARFFQLNLILSQIIKIQDAELQEKILSDNISRNDFWIKAS